jgi:Histidine kinase-, DNA gyrase B-, and HSP90-like ATPase
MPGCCQSHWCQCRGWPGRCGVHAHRLSAAAFQNARLMLNGIEAMKGMGTAGELTIRSQQDRQLLISVGDTGVGLRPEQAEQIFNPFFATKLLRAPAWDCPSAGPSSNLTAAVYGPSPTPGQVHAFSLFCQPRSGEARLQQPPSRILNKRFP